MIDKNDKVKIDINGSIADSASGIASDAATMAFVGIFIGMLVAPLFSKTMRIIVRDAHKKVFPHELREQKIKSDMILVNIILWVSCIIAWAVIYKSFNHG